MARRSREDRTESVKSIDDIVAANFRRLRADAGLDIYDVAAWTGYSANTIRKIDAGKQEIKAGLLSDLAEMFNCREDEFFHGLPCPMSGKSPPLPLNRDIAKLREHIFSKSGRLLNEACSKLRPSHRTTIVGLVKGLASRKHWQTPSTRPWKPPGGLRSL
jgi:hypothetical protein